MLPVGPNFAQSQPYAYPPAGHNPFLGGHYLTQDPGLGATVGPSAPTAAGPAIDLNSPELFKPNLRNVHQQVIQLQDLARRTLSGIQNAYQSGSSPKTTENDMQTLSECLKHLIATLRQTGLGALPLLQDPTSSTSVGPTMPPTEAQLLEQTNKGLQDVYEKLKRSQDSAQVVANLLSVDFTQRPPGGGAAGPSGAPIMAPQVSQQPSTMSQASHR